ncbi:glutathione peroxidase GpwA [Cupriavidus necator N-1]|uniref:Glutathione peroxidase n=1 Tax=Cupriavidus necator (strain ATCC 43291 / DSM 13513 / CCUG 52238 / LMG 8453 / N-1) TaxID=1042878 RepID=G0ES02_CUPNN|nr:glutathione peroxidase [Cupriavidus necator]AEI75430.1 glutathione peroxidase GpwA [Cupriavidus necator N-1]KAI3608612.1 Glutathione peroxidase [Cupriavidus necator H850]MDX6012427.1 glutathione peroxidase [Cupriavidus necator]
MTRRFPSSATLRQLRPAALAGALALAAAGAALLPHPARAADKPAAAPAPQATGACPASLNFKFPRLQDEAPQNLCQYAGKVVLVVNTASYCGFTPQYEGLEALYSKYRDRGLVVLGFPSNDFSQEPGSEKQIADFCYNTYGVKFPMLGKSHVRGSEANPMYALLAKETGTAPKWNFYKYLIGRNGQVVGSYNSKTTPDDKKFVAKIEELLASPR